MKIKNLNNLIDNHFNETSRAISNNRSFNKKIINLAEKKNKKLHELELKEINQIEPKLTLNVYKILNLENSVNSKKSYGGTSFENVKKMIKKAKNE